MSYKAATENKTSATTHLRHQQQETTC